MRITASKATNRNAPISSGKRNSAPPRPIRPPGAPMMAPPPVAPANLLAFKSNTSRISASAYQLTQARRFQTETQIAAAVVSFSVSPAPVHLELKPARAVPKSLLCSEESEERVSESNRDGRDGRLQGRVL